MSIAFVLDENLRGKPIWHAIRRQKAGSATVIDATRVGDPADLPLGSSDADVLVWAELANRIIVTQDVATFPAELMAHLRRGHTSPGIFVIRPNSAISLVVAWLELVATDDQPNQWRDQVFYIP